MGYELPALPKPLERLPGALCSDMDVNFFFPEQYDAKGVAAAKAVCALCPVRETCLDRALERGEEFGIWGGTSENQRRKLRRQRKIHKASVMTAEHGTEAGYMWHWRHEEGPVTCVPCKDAHRATNAEAKARAAERQRRYHDRQRGIEPATPGILPEVDREKLRARLLGTYEATA